MPQETEEFDFEKLLDLENVEARQALSPVSLENVSHKFARQALQDISKEMEGLCCRAMTEVDQFAAANDAAEKGDKTTLRCRVRKKDSTLEISWERQFYYERKSPPGKDSKAPCFVRESEDGKKRLYGLKSQHIRKGMQDRYPRRSLTYKTEPEWATDTADQMEEKFEILRRQIRMLGQIRKLLYHYDQLSKRYYDLVVGDDENPKRLKPVVASQKTLKTKNRNRNKNTIIKQSFNSRDIQYGSHHRFRKPKGRRGQIHHDGSRGFLFRPSGKEKVLVVDMDAQANSTATLIGRKTPLTSTRSEHLFDRELDELKVQKTEFGIDVIGSSLTDDDGYDVESLPVEMAALPSMHLEKLRDQYDYIFIDCPPTLGRRLLSALLAADYVIMPVKLSGYAVDGLQRLFNTLVTIKEGFNPSLEILGAIINEYDGTAAHRIALAEVQEALPGLVFDHYLRHRSPIDMASRGEPVWKVRNGQRAAEEFAAIFKEMKQKIIKFEKNKNN